MTDCLQHYFAEYFSFFSKVLEFWVTMQDKSVSLLRPLFNQTEQLRLCFRAQLEGEFLKKFPDVKENLLGKIQICIEEEITPLIQVQEEMKTYLDGLRSRLSSLELAYCKCDLTSNSENFNPLVPSCEKLLEHAVDIWRCFHVLWIGVKTSIETVDYYDLESVKRISDAFMKYKQVESRMQYHLELTKYLRISLDSKEKNV